MFLWDAANIEHIARHSITPEEAEQVFQNEPLDLERQVRNGERRTLHLGQTDAGRTLFVILAMRGKDHRVVTAYPAGERSRRFYESQRRSAPAPGDRDA